MSYFDGSLAYLNQECLNTYEIAASYRRSGTTVDVQLIRLNDETALPAGDYGMTEGFKVDPNTLPSGAPRVGDAVFVGEWQYRVTEFSHDEGGMLILTVQAEDRP